MGSNTVSISSTLYLFLSMIILALIPGPGVLVVTARTATAGFYHGISATMGILAGDFIFITLALIGLTALSVSLGDLFIYVKYVGAAYLIWLGLSLLWSKNSTGKTVTTPSPSHASSFTSGLVVTLSNPKAILFYVSFLPAFLDLSIASAVDAMILYIVATIAIGGVMLTYAYITHKTKTSLEGSRKGALIRYGSGVLLLGSGLYVAARS
jgi:threonine/homoserine/homoserine lactone efflux protein